MFLQLKEKVVWRGWEAEVFFRTVLYSQIGICTYLERLARRILGIGIACPPPMKIAGNIVQRYTDGYTMNSGLLKIKKLYGAWFHVN
jgi:hypothetical protein